LARFGGTIDAIMDWSFPKEDKTPSAAPTAPTSAPQTLLGRAPAEFGALMPLFFEYYEKGDPVAKELMELELSYIDNYVNWFKTRGVSKFAAVGGFGTRLYPLMTARYGAYIVTPKHEPLHGAVILAKQIFGQ
jgi:glucosamine kinase